MLKRIAQIWRKLKGYFRNSPKEENKHYEKVSEVVRPEIKRSPGLDCPQCGFRIQVSIAMLLSGEPILCPACGLKISVDQEKSQACLSELRKVHDAIQKAEEVKSSTR